MLVITLFAKTLSELKNKIEKASKIADIIEWRFDYTEGAELEQVYSVKSVPMILTCRSLEQGGFYSDTEAQRVGILNRAIKTGFEYIDVELSAFDKINRSYETKIIVSHHDFYDFLDIEVIYQQMLKTDADIIKIAVTPADIDDNLTMLNLIKNSKRPICGICLGETGHLTRVLGNSYGNSLTYASLDDNQPAAPGQIPAATLQNLYRYNEINDETKLYGLVGYPIKQSKGFQYHNLAFIKENSNAVYINFPVKELSKFVHSYKHLLNGFSVTMPYKIEILNYLDEIDETARHINAVNTVAVKNGKMFGFSTDYTAINRIIDEQNLYQASNILIIGAGGLAQTMLHAFSQYNSSIYLVNRTYSRTKSLADKYDCVPLDFHALSRRKPELIINCASPDLYTSSYFENVKSLIRKSNQILWDTNYMDGKTPLIDYAEKNFLSTISGEQLFRYQAAEQQKIWSEML